MKRFAAALGVCLAVSAPVHAQEFVTVLTGGTSGVYYPLGVALNSIYSKAIPNAKVTVQATKASVENLNLLQAGRGEIAFTLGDSLSDAWKGREEAGFKAKLDKLRGVAGIYPNYIQIVAAKDSGIKTLADLKGKRVSVGAPKSGTELNARAIFGAAGMSYNDFAKTEYLPFAESVDLMKNRQLDATLISAGLGVAAVKDLATSQEITVVSVPADIVQKVGDPAYIAETVPAGTYNGQTEAVPTAAVRNFLATHSGVPEASVYAMVKSMYENLEGLTSAHAAARQIKMDADAAKSPVPLHPGAEKFYKEKGLLK
jgi:TRAP transporter TAXI family solute receptor